MEEHFEAKRVFGPSDDFAFMGLETIFDHKRFDTLASALHCLRRQLEIPLTLHDSQACSLVVEQFEKLLQCAELPIVNSSGRFIE
ncbi:hypothetical protein ASE28_17010 [Acidovorax sp. Root219]|nr:hypothetical protein ASE28_17010 [Acidovorax sp. Root219]